MNHLKTDVLIVGAGPTGLMAANQLARFGINFIIIDKKEGPTKESRAIVVTARSLEIYQQMGLDQKAVSGGKVITSFNLYSGGSRKAEVKIGEIGKGLSQFSYMLAFEQSKNEELLSNALIKSGNTIHWNVELLKLLEYQQVITAEVKSIGQVNTIEAHYLIACDGANSAVRQQLNFSFKGGTYDHKFFVADTRMKWGLEYNKLVISPGDLNFCAFLPLEGEGGYRVLGTLPKKYANSENISFRDIEQVVKHTLGIPIEFKSVNWFSVYKLHHRSVDHFREGCVFLAGDSAHIHSPAGGQGMNTWLQDAYNLCWKLALVIRKQASTALLDTYNEERLPFAYWLMNFTDRGFNLMTNMNPIIKFFRKYIALNVAGLVLSNPWFRPRGFKIISQIWYSYKGKSLSRSFTRQRLSFRTGDRVPFIAQRNVHLLLTAPTFHLLHLGEKLGEDLKLKIKSMFPFPVTVVEEQVSEEWKKLGVTKELFMLVRPDNYIALTADSIDQPDVKSYLRTLFP